MRFPEETCIAYFLEFSEYSPLISIPSGVPQASHIPNWLPPERKESLRLASNQQASTIDGPKKRLDTTSISSCNHNMSVRVIDAKGILSVQFRQEFHSIVFVQREHTFAVTSPTELIVGLLKYIRAEVFVVVDLTVYDCGDCFGGVMEWLIASRCQIVDLEARIAKACSLSADEDPLEHGMMDQAVDVEVTDRQDHSY